MKGFFLGKFFNDYLLRKAVLILIVQVVFRPWNSRTMLWMGVEGFGFGWC